MRGMPALSANPDVMDVLSKICIVSLYPQLPFLKLRYRFGDFRILLFIVTSGGQIEISSLYLYDPNIHS